MRVPAQQGLPALRPALSGTGRSVAPARQPTRRSRANGATHGSVEWARIGGAGPDESPFAGLPGAGFPDTGRTIRVIPCPR
jgi:hypothetical protein